MRYLSIDLEATGLNPHDLIIEFAMVPFCTQKQELADELQRSYLIKCPSFEKLKPNLDSWVIEHNESLIRKAHSEGIDITQFKAVLTEYLQSNQVRNYFKNDNNDKITLFGKSLNAIDLPFLNRDLGDDFMKKYFMHRVLDLSSVVHAMVDIGKLPPCTISGSELMKYYEMGEVAHTALEDAINTALLYLKIIKDQIS